MELLADIMSPPVMCKILTYLQTCIFLERVFTELIRVSKKINKHCSVSARIFCLFDLSKNEVGVSTSLSSLGLLSVLLYPLCCKVFQHMPHSINAHCASLSP